MVGELKQLLQAGEDKKAEGVLHSLIRKERMSEEPLTALQQYGHVIAHVQSQAISAALFEAVNKQFQELCSQDLFELLAQMEEEHLKFQMLSAYQSLLANLLRDVPNALDRSDREKRDEILMEKRLEIAIEYLVNVYDQIDPEFKARPFIMDKGLRHDLQEYFKKQGEPVPPMLPHFNMAKIDSVKDKGLQERLQASRAAYLKSKEQKWIQQHIADHHQRSLLPIKQCLEQLLEAKIIEVRDVKKSLLKAGVQDEYVQSLEKRKP